MNLGCAGWQPKSPTPEDERRLHDVLTSIFHPTDKAIMNNPFIEIVKLQAEANDMMTSNGPWRINNRTYDYATAIRKEVDEADGSTGWKLWWKKHEVSFDLVNLRVELIDILHFHISGMIQEQQHQEVVAGLLYAQSGQLIRDAKISDITQIDYFPRKRLNEYLGVVLLHGCTAATPILFDLFYRAGMDEHAVAAKYFAKNALNRFRTNNGDKTGGYIKIWGDIEDNYHVMAYADDLAAITMTDARPITMDEMYDGIRNLYKEFTGRDGV